MNYLICDFETTGIGPDAKPIEVAIILLREDFSPAGYGEWLIKDHVEQKIEWTTPDEQQAFYYSHKMSPSYIYDNGQYLKEIREEILKIVPDPSNTVLISDNTPFEHQHWKASEFPKLHYRTVDYKAACMFLGVDRNKGRKTHRAFQDCLCVLQDLSMCLLKSRSLGIEMSGVI